MSPEISERSSEQATECATTTRISCHIKAPREVVYRTLLDSRAIAKWKVPDGMSCRVHAFDAREGGSLRISLTYDSPTGTGKTTRHTDTYRGRFVTLVPNERIVEVDEFETDDPAFRGEMTITITLSEVAGGTDLLAVHDGLPRGVPPEDNETGWRMALAKLAALVEAGADTDAQLRAEADAMLASGLQEALETYGDVHVVGSYRMHLMAWRDLDVHVVREPLDRAAFFALGERVASLLSPQRMHYRDETVAATPGLPTGLYWGVYLGDERKGAWKIDVWATGPEGLERVTSYCESIERQLTPSSRKTILDIKSKCWMHPQYRRAFSSEDVYDAVLEHGVRDVERFWTYLGDRVESP